MSNSSTRILVVDDEKMTRLSLVDFLRDAGFCVSEVSSAEDAIVQQQENHYQVCIVDIRMPGKDGVETILNLHRICPETRYIVYTGSPQFTLSPELHLTGITEKHIVRKPVFDMQLFVHIIQALLTSKP